jgi:tetratricopeptide (TPR) repeat protein
MKPAVALPLALVAAVAACRSPDRLERALELEHAGAVVPAEEAFRDAIADPGDLRARRRYAAFLAATGRPDPAMSELEEALRRAPADVPTLLLAADLDREAKHFDAAAVRLALARKAAPRDPRPLVALGRLELARGAPDRATAAYREALRLDPSHAEAYRRLGELRLAGNDPAGAAADFRRALERDSADPAALTGLADAALALGDRREAIEAARRLTEVRPDDAAAFRRLADLLLAEHEWEASMRAYWQARALDPALPGVDAGIFHATEGLSREQLGEANSRRPESPPPVKVK